MVSIELTLKVKKADGSNRTVLLSMGTDVQKAKAEITNMGNPWIEIPFPNGGVDLVSKDQIATISIAPVEENPQVLQEQGDQKQEPLQVVPSKEDEPPVN